MYIGSPFNLPQRHWLTRMWWKYQIIWMILWTRAYLGGGLKPAPWGKNFVSIFSVKNGFRQWHVFIAVAVLVYLVAVSLWPSAVLLYLVAVGLWPSAVLVYLVAVSLWPSAVMVYLVAVSLWPSAVLVYLVAVSLWPSWYTLWPLVCGCPGIPCGR